MNILKEKVATVIRHQFYRSIMLFVSIFACIWVIMPSGFLQNSGILSLQRLVQGKFGQPTREFVFDKITELTFESGNDPNYDYYIGETDGNVMLIKTHVGELSPTKRVIGNKSSTLKNIGGITEATAEHFDQPKIALLGKLMNKSGVAIEKYALNIAGYYAKSDSAFVSKFDQQLLNKFGLHRMIVSPSLYYIPNIFWFLPLTVMLFIIDGIYLLIRKNRMSAYIISRASEYNIDASYQSIDESFNRASLSHQLSVLPEGLMTREYLFIEKYAKFYLINLSEILIFSDKSGEILLKKRKFPVHLKLSQSSIHQIKQWIQMSYPAIETDHEKIKPYRETHEAPREGIWEMIWKSLLTEIGLLIAMFIVVTLFIMPGISFSVFIILLIVVAILGGLGF